MSKNYKKIIQNLVLPDAVGAKMF